MGVASLVVGIIGILAALNPFASWAGIILSIVALVLGILGRRSAMAENLPSGAATAGMVLGICGAVLGTMLFAACMYCTKKVGEAGKSFSEALDKAVKEAKEEEEREAKIVRHIGDTVELKGDSRWVVVSAKDRGATLTVPRGHAKVPAAHTEGRFVEVRFRVINLRSEDQEVTEQPKIVDGEGRQLAPFADEDAFLDGKSLAGASLPPSLPREFEEIYEVPKDATNLKVQAVYLLFGRAKLVQLGL
jgi:hypothetical protein